MSQFLTEFDLSDVQQKAIRAYATIVFHVLLVPEEKIITGYHRIEDKVRACATSLLAGIYYA